jgi:hypothetical protein
MGVAKPDTKPILWHIPVSHFSEKARWARAYQSSLPGSPLNGPSISAVIQPP